MKKARWWKSKLMKIKVDERENDEAVTKWSCKLMKMAIWWDRKLM